MKCTTCGMLLQSFTLLTNTGSESVLKCPVCQKSTIEAIQKGNCQVSNKILTELGVPKRYLSASLIREFMSFSGVEEVLKGSKGLFLLGASGTGKTYQMVAWIRYHIALGSNVAYIDFSDFLCDMRYEGRKYTTLKSIYADADVIFMDDFDSSNPYVFELVYNFVNTLYKEQKIMFFTAESLPVQDKLAMRIGATTIQLELIKGQ